MLVFFRIERLLCFHFLGLYPSGSGVTLRFHFRFVCLSQLPDPEVVQDILANNFFEIYRDSEGRPVFRTWKVVGENILNDFWIRQLTEADESEMKPKGDTTPAWIQSQEMKAKEAFDAKKNKHDL
jgi:hypothetical protein